MRGMKPWIMVAGIAAGLFLAGCGDELATGATAASIVKMGSGTRSDFDNKILDVTVTSLSSGGSTTVTATLVDGNGYPYTESATIYFFSDCSARGKADLTSPIVTTNGIATSTYTAKGCEGSDKITAFTTITPAEGDPYRLEASGTVTVQSAAAGSIEFVSAEPATIGIKGIGLNENAKLTFILKDQAGTPIRSKVINFELTTTVGGISIYPSTATTDANGTVAVFVNSGTVPTTVYVKATLAENPAVSSLSRGLAVTTGIASQESISLSASTLNPEAWDFNGETSTINIHIADRYHNPVPDGTVIYFTAEGGQIDPQCQTTNGGCSLEWRSSDPRPTGGRATILASTQGDETFVDSNGNGSYDDGEPFTDLPEAWRDDDEDGVYDAGVEEFRDYNNNGRYDGANGLYDGVMCNGPTLCGTSKMVEVRDSLILVMSTSSLTITLNAATYDICPGPATPTITICDGNNQYPPAGTSVAVTETHAEATISSGASFTTPNTNANNCYVYTGLVITSTTGAVCNDGTAGSLIVTATTPKGVVSTATASLTD